MILALFDIRPLIGLALLPVAAGLGFLLWRVAFRSSSWLLCQMAAFAVSLAAFQFIYYGPFIDQDEIQWVKTTVKWRPDIGPNAIEFAFPEKFGFNNLLSNDIDVANHVRERNLKEVELRVELGRTFGSIKSMNTMYAFADGILFAPVDRPPEPVPPPPPPEARATESR
ncbi:hypothetical protein DB346_14995 [Verrucomicrobia bacterium LW23]|nr:hypothetical protein DB346_14995 [Verrucomicrobia bacterium LW23]